MRKERGTKEKGTAKEKGTFYFSASKISVGSQFLLIYSVQRRAQLIEMKTLRRILLVLFVTLPAHAGPGSATSELNTDLVPIYESLMKEERPTHLVGKRLKLTLNLKYASDQHLLFTDTRVVIDKDTKYYLIKWKFKPDDVKALLGKSNVRCKVDGRIVEVIKGPTSPGMPYIVVELMSVEF